MTGGESKSRAVDWGLIVDNTDFIMQEVRIGTLNFNAVDFGDDIRLSQISREHLACGDANEINQCTLLHLCAGLEWVSQKRPKRVPSRSRVETLARTLREKEINEAQEMLDTSSTSTVEEVVRSLTHDVLTPHHDRDFRTTCLFLLDEISELAIQAFRIVEVSDDCTSTIVHNFQISAVEDETNPIYCIAYRGHMRWMQPSVLTGRNLWKEWRNQFDCIREIMAINWVTLLETMEPSTLNLCPAVDVVKM